MGVGLDNRFNKNLKLGGDVNTLSASEAAFVRAGGMLWCMKEISNQRWELFSLASGKRRRFLIKPQSVARAEDWIYALAFVSSLSYNVNIHHSIARRTIGESLVFPPMCLTAS